MNREDELFGVVVDDPQPLLARPPLIPAAPAAAFQQEQHLLKQDVEVPVFTIDHYILIMQIFIRKNIINLCFFIAIWGGRRRPSAHYLQSLFTRRRGTSIYNQSLHFDHVNIY
jgi:hypothetical protein